MQLPPEQRCPAGQTTPHAPQAQVLPHLVSPLGQASHRADLQIELLGQGPQVAPAIPHFDSLWLSGYRQVVPSQHPGQDVLSQTQVPPAQCCPEPQAVSQLPQRALLFCVSTHAPSHSDEPGAQPQWPSAWQVSGLVHGPQLAPALPQRRSD
jgi:hypothetical protein